MPITHRLSELFVHSIEQASNSVVVSDADNCVVLFNQAAEQLWGLKCHEVLSLDAKCLLPLPVRSYYQQQEDGEGELQIQRITHRDGSQHWGSLSISRVVSHEQIYFVTSIKDITRHHEESERLRLLSLVTDHSDNAIIITDGQWRISYVNAGFERMFGYRFDQVYGQHPSALLAPHLGHDVIASARQTLSAGQSINTDQLTGMHNGERLWCSVVVNPILDKQGRLLNAVGILTDITSSKMHEILQHSMLNAMVREEPLEDLMLLACREIERIAPDVTTSMLLVDEEGLLHPLASHSLRAGYCQSMEGIKIGEGVGTCGTAAFRGQPVVSKDIASDPLWDGYRQVELPEGIKSCWSTPIMGANQRVIATLAFYFKENRGPSEFHQRLVEVIVPLCALAIEREKSRAHISQLAFYDSLTELPNRSLLLANTEQALHAAQRNKTSLAVLFIDVDRFKQVNDSFGHPAGDELLQIIARRLQENRSPKDIVGRLSGDEFVVVLPECDNQRVTELVEQMKLTISQPCQVGNSRVSPSVSIGVSLFPEDGHDMGTLIHRADMAMYQAKNAGRGRFSFFCHELNQLAQERQAMENALQQALQDNVLELHYQPQINLADGRLYGAEALARWNHPHWGQVSPARFIPLAEECGLIVDLGLWAIREACRQLADWRRKGAQLPAISVNLSPTNFHDLALPAMLMALLDEHQLCPADLTLELTENILMDTNPSTLKVLNDVHALGIRLAMDDFGTGYSSLSYLRKLPIQELKLDRSFVMDLENDATARTLSDAVIHIGKSLNLTVVAEGIETEGQHEILKQQGYHVAQGYLFSRPQSAQDLERWLLAR